MRTGKWRGHLRHQTIDKIYASSSLAGDHMVRDGVHVHAVSREDRHHSREEYVCQHAATALSLGPVEFDSATA